MGSRDVSRAVEVLCAGGLVAFPTETVYGLGADAANAEAVSRIFTAKGRPADHPLIVHIPRTESLTQWAVDVPDAAWLLARRFWPGPLTLILRRHPTVLDLVTGSLETVGIRVPAHPLALDLLERFGGGVAAPSANRFGAVSPTTAGHVREGLGDTVDFLLNGGPCAVGVESTIVDVAGDRPTILRPGGVTRENLEQALGCFVPVAATSRTRAPGQHPSHYAPRARVLLVEADDVVTEARRLQAKGRRVGVLLPPARARPDTSGIGHVVISVPESLEEYARQLYDILRELDRRGCEIIVASLPAEEGAGLAIADRLRRAAGPVVQS